MRGAPEKDPDLAPPDRVMSTVVAFPSEFWRSDTISSLLLIDPEFPKDPLVVHASGVKIKADHLRPGNGGAKEHHHKSRQKRAAYHF